MRTGWEIVIVGQNFDPTEFFKTSRIQPSHFWQREVEEDEKRYKQRGIEFSDWHEGPYPLDMVMEALDYLEAHRDEFKKLFSLPGIDDRCLNFVDNCGSNNFGCMFNFTREKMFLLASFGLSISIVISPHSESPKIDQSLSYNKDQVAPSPSS